MCGMQKRHHTLKLVRFKIDELIKKSFGKTAYNEGH
jgi:hypothetical protein